MLQRQHICTKSQNTSCILLLGEVLVGLDEVYIELFDVAELDGGIVGCRAVPGLLGEVLLKPMPTNPGRRANWCA